MDNNPQESAAPKPSKLRRIFDLGAILFLLAVALALLGGGLSVFGIGAAFGRAGTWAEGLVALGLGLIGLGGLLNLIATVWGASQLARKKRFCWWWPLSVIVTGVALYGLYVLVNL
ncbi:MAG: hypothetical protein WCJ97_02185 [Phycisphaerae bacterium]